MLRAVPTAWYASRFRLVRDDGREVGFLKPSWFSEKAVFSVRDVQFSFYRETLLGDFVLEFEDQVVLRAAKPSALTRRFTFEAEGVRYELDAESSFQRAFVLRRSGSEAVIGRIAPTRWLTRKTEIDLPEALPLPVQAFCFWLVLILWNRAAAAS